MKTRGSEGREETRREGKHNSAQGGERQGKEWGKVEWHGSDGQKRKDGQQHNAEADPPLSLCRVPGKAPSRYFRHFFLIVGPALNYGS